MSVLTIADIMISTVSSSRMFTEWVRPRTWHGIIWRIEMQIFRYASCSRGRERERESGGKESMGEKREREEEGGGEEEKGRWGEKRDKK